MAAASGDGVREVDVQGQVCFITGANTGIGKVTALELARRGMHVIIAVRSVEKGAVAANDIKATTGNDRVEVVLLDMASLDSVRECARQFLARGLPIHRLILNAGVAAFAGLTSDGFEWTWGVNHVAHFLLTMLLMPAVRRAERARIIALASKAHYDCSALDPEDPALRQRTGTVTGLPEYQRSKLANVLFAAELNRRLATSDPSITVVSLHPGVIKTDIWRAVPVCFRWCVTARMLTPEQGALTTLHCTLSPAVPEHPGTYWDDCKLKTPSKLALDADLARRVWAATERWCGAGLEGPVSADAGGEAKQA